MNSNPFQMMMQMGQKKQSASHKPVQFDGNNKYHI